MKPTTEQEDLLNRMAGCRRYIWNWALDRRKEHYRDFGKTLTFKALCAELTAL
jgi:putative transposase